MSILYDSLSSFHAISSQGLRSQICEYLSSNPEIAGSDAKDIVQWQTNIDLNKYIPLMRKNAWGGAVEIKAYCDIYEMNVLVKVPMNKREIEFLSKKAPTNGFAFNGRGTILRHVEV